MTGKGKMFIGNPMFKDNGSTLLTILSEVEGMTHEKPA